MKNSKLKNTPKQKKDNTFSVSTFIIGLTFLIGSMWLLVEKAAGYEINNNYKSSYISSDAYVPQISTAYVDELIEEY